MKINSLINKVFTGGQWHIAYRIIDDKNEAITKNVFYKITIPNKKYWCADPFLYQFEDKLYIFFEAFDKRKEKGNIGVAELVDGRLENFQIIIEKKYHMSYPCVFLWKNVHYMIPETSDNRTIELYRAECFPSKWVLHSILQWDKSCVDSTVFFHNGELVLFSYETVGRSHKLNIYKLDIQNNKLVFQNSIPYIINKGRPAGCLFFNKGKIIRPSQDCQNKYGQNIIFNEIAEWNTEKYKEHSIGCLKKDDVIFVENSKADRIHTVNLLNNVVVIDFFIEKFELLHSLKILRRRLRKCFSRNNVFRKGLNNALPCKRKEDSFFNWQHD